MTRGFVYNAMMLCCRHYCCTIVVGATAFCFCFCVYVVRSTWLREHVDHEGGLEGQTADNWAPFHVGFFSMEGV